jgi:ABC-type nitrate/sulfonate/bicarbonate transport system ATPase subunit
MEGYDLTVTHHAEEQAIYLLSRIVMMSERDQDALSGQAVHHVKEALTILRERRNRKLEDTE